MRIFWKATVVHLHSWISFYLNLIKIKTCSASCKPTLLCFDFRLKVCLYEITLVCILIIYLIDFQRHAHCSNSVSLFEHAKCVIWPIFVLRTVSTKSIHIFVTHFFFYYFSKHISDLSDVLVNKIDLLKS